MSDDVVTMTIISRADAKARGLTRYFTGLPCKNNNHICERLVSDAKCIECSRIKKNSRKRIRRRSLEYRDKEKARRMSPEYKEKDKAMRSLIYASQEYKEKDKVRRSLPKYKDRAKEIRMSEEYKKRRNEKRRQIRLNEEYEAFLANLENGE